MREAFMKLLGAWKNRLNDNVAGWIDIAPAAISFESRESLGEVTYDLETERDDDSAGAVNESAAVVLHDIEERIWRCGGLWTPRTPRFHTSNIARHAVGNEGAVRCDFAAGTAAVVDALIGAFAFTKIGGAPLEKAAGTLI